jgi:glutamine synthetase
MMRLCEKYEVDLVLHCKPIKGDWNGSGMHCNFSTKYIREVGGKEYLEALMKAFENNIPEHIAVYGPDNHLRLTGLHETQAIDKFSYGLSDRGASIRCPSTSSRTATRATWKIAVRTPKPIPTRSSRAS